jgi:hypothetical protein
MFACLLLLVVTLISEGFFPLGTIACFKKLYMNPFFAASDVQCCHSLFIDHGKLRLDIIYLVSGCYKGSFLFLIHEMVMNFPE